jgi:hypothetical protein
MSKQLALSTALSVIMMSAFALFGPSTVQARVPLAHAKQAHVVVDCLPGFAHMLGLGD